VHRFCRRHAERARSSRRLPAAALLLLAMSVHLCALPAPAAEAATELAESLQVASPAEPNAAAASDSGSGLNSEAQARSRVVVLYFHRTLRCDTCLKFEAYSEATLRDSFPDDLAEGTLVWRTVNLDEPEESHFADEHDLFESSLVVTTEIEGAVVEWNKLADIWGLVHDEPMFRDYVAFETEKSLRALSSHERDRSTPAEANAVEGLKTTRTSKGAP
jgi:hypothetical protein